MSKNNTRNMTEGNVMRVLLLFTVPIFISNLFQQLYNVVDVAVIGHVLGIVLWPQWAQLHLFMV